MGNRCQTQSRKIALVHLAIGSSVFILYQLQWVHFASMKLHKFFSNASVIFPKGLKFQKYLLKSYTRDILDFKSIQELEIHDCSFMQQADPATEISAGKLEVLNFRYCLIKEKLSNGPNIFQDSLTPYQNYRVPVFNGNSNEISKLIWSHCVVIDTSPE